MCKINVQFQREKKYMYDEEIYIQMCIYAIVVYARTHVLRESQDYTKSRKYVLRESWL